MLQLLESAQHHLELAEVAKKEYLSVGDSTTLRDKERLAIAQIDAVVHSATAICYEIAALRAILESKR